MVEDFEFMVLGLGFSGVWSLGVWGVVRTFQLQMSGVHRAS